MAQAQTSTRANGSPEASYSELSEQVAILKSDFSDMASTVEKLFGEQKAELKKMAANKAGYALNVAGDAATKATDTAVQARDTTVEAIKERPLTALAVAGGIGLLIGVLSRKS